VPARRDCHGDRLADDVRDRLRKYPRVARRRTSLFSGDKHTVCCAIHSRVIAASIPKQRQRIIDDLEDDSAPMNDKSSPEELIKYRRYALRTMWGGTMHWSTTSRGENILKRRGTDHDLA
jgi:hypothetical protein